MTRKPHGIPGQLNTYELDTDGQTTGYGKHKRCVVAGDGPTVEVRADDVPTSAHLPWPTVKQAWHVAMGEARVHKRGIFKYAGCIEWTLAGREARTFTFKVKP